jgi:hypothetical protein
MQFSRKKGFIENETPVLAGFMEQKCFKVPASYGVWFFE